MPLVSVIIPTYNYGRFLMRAVNSVLAQTLNDFELIIVDDGSTDDTPEVAAAINDRRVSYYRQANQGPSAARNTGIAQASGEFIAFLDADDLWLPEKLRLQVAVLSANPAAGMVYGHCAYVDSLGSVVRTAGNSGRGRLLMPLLRKNIISGSASAILIRATCLRQLGGFEPQLRGNEDWHLWLRVAARWEIEVVDAVIAHITDHPSSSSKNTWRMTRDTVVMVALLENELADRIAPAVWRKAWSYALMGVAHYYVGERRLARARQVYWHSLRLNPTNIPALVLWLGVIAGPDVYSLLWKLRSALPDRACQGAASSH